jgi:hypothetical protein
VETMFDFFKASVISRPIGIMQYGVKKFQ